MLVRLQLKCESEFVSFYFYIFVNLKSNMARQM